MNIIFACIGYTKKLLYPTPGMTGQITVYLILIIDLCVSDIHFGFNTWHYTVQYNSVFYINIIFACI